MSMEFRYYAFLKIIKLQQNVKKRVQLIQKINKWITKANNLKFVKTSWMKRNQLKVSGKSTGNLITVSSHLFMSM